MSIWDFVILILLLAGAYRGYQKGLLMAIVSFVALIAGLIGAIAWTPALMTHLSERSDLSSEILSVLAFLAIFIGIIIALNIAGRFIKMVIDLTPIGAIDGLVGALLGMLKWALGISIILWIMDKAQLGLPEDEHSALLTNVRQVAPYVFEQLVAWSPYFEELLANIGNIITNLRK